MNPIDEDDFYELQNLAKLMETEVDDPILLVARGNAKLEAKVHHLVEVLVHVSESNAFLRAELQELKPIMGELVDSQKQVRLEFEQAKKQNRQQKEVIQKLAEVWPEIWLLKESVKELKSGQDENIKQTDSIRVSTSWIQETETNNRQWLKGALSVMSLLILVQSYQVFTMNQWSQSVGSQLQYIQQRAEWAMTKLQRLEEREP